MISTALMLREVRAESRKALNYRLRATIAAVGTLTMGWLVAGNSDAISGFDFFAVFHMMSLGVILLVGPLLTADSISRERREGTLPLLFLTPLTGPKLIATKFAAQFLRAFGFWLALFPVGVVPLMFGGISPVQVASAAVVQFLCLVLGLTGGMLASAFGTRFFPTIAASIAATFLLLELDLLLLLVGATGDFHSGYFFAGYEILKFQRGFAVLTHPALVRSLAANFLLLLVAIPLLFRWIGRCLAREQSGAIESAAQRRFRELFLRPLFWKSAFNKVMSHRMAQNPLIWLEYRHAWSRAGRWMMVAGLIVFNSWLIAKDWGSLWGNQMLCLWVLAMLMCFSTASSFQNERETGAFELLLVAPFTEGELFWGRIRALWSYYRPALAGVLLSMFAVSAFLPYVFNRTNSDDVTQFRILSLLLSFGTIPVAGLYFALRFKQFPVILGLTAITGVVLPAHFPDLLQILGKMLPIWLGGDFLYYSFREPSLLMVMMAAAIHLVLFIQFSEKAILQLRGRTFAN